MNELALCAGIGCFSLALKRAGAGRTVCYVELADYPIEVLTARIRDGSLDDAPIWDDLTTFDGRPWRGLVDLVTAGFPCQPFSVSGKRLGEQDERYLWPHVIRTIREVGPRYVLLENVPGLLSMGRGTTLGAILGDLATWLSDCGGGRIESICLRASDFGAPHRRERLFLVAYPSCQPVLGRKQPRISSDSPPEGEGVLADSNGQGFSLWDRREGPGGTPSSTDRRGAGETQSRVGRESAWIADWVDSYQWPSRPGEPQYEWESERTVTQTVPHRVARLKALGNSIALPCAEYMMRHIKDYEDTRLSGTPTLPG